MNIWDDISSFVSKSAPVLGAAISATNPLARLGISLISQAFGADKNNGNDILSKLTNDPDYMKKLEKIEYEHEEALQKIASDNMKTEVDDRKDARNMNIQLHNYVPTIIAIGYCLTYVVIQFYCIIHPQTANDVISARLHDGLMMILAYFFGRNHDNMFNNKDN